jgi:CubicO group peptidase (beta-lactamase class C family)
MMTAAIILAALVAVAASVFAYLKHRMANARDQGNLEADIDAEVAKLLKGARVPGLVVGVYKDGRSLIKGHGTTGRADGAAPDAHTIYQIGSISKVFTASLLQILCDEDVVSLEATLGDLLGSSMPMSPAARQVTLRQLVTHTSGFPSIPKSLGAKAGEKAGSDDHMLDPYSYLGPQFIFEYLATTEDKREPGRFEYSNFGMGLLGHVLERVTGKELESLVAEKILAPFGMTETGIALTPRMQSRLAQGHTSKGVPTRIWTFAALAGAGAFNSSARDMLTFIRGLVEEGGPFVDLLRKMREPQPGGQTGIGWMLPTFVDRFVGNKDIVWHNGMVNGYASYLAVDARARAGVVILTNKAIGPEMLGMMLMRKVRTQSWAQSSRPVLSRAEVV